MHSAKRSCARETVKSLNLRTRKPPPSYSSSCRRTILMSSETRRCAPVPTNKRKHTQDLIRHMGVIMKSSVIRGLVIFAAGAATAALASGMYPKEPITAGQFQERALRADGRSRSARCLCGRRRKRPHRDLTPIRLPACRRIRRVPNLPERSVDTRMLAHASKALNVYNEGRMHDERSRCTTSAGASRTRRRLRFPHIRSTESAGSGPGESPGPGRTPENQQRGAEHAEAGRPRKR